MTDSVKPRVELPTLLLIFAVYAGWFVVTYAYGRWPLWVVVPAAILLITLHGSLQHEIVHGHPTRWFDFNRALGMIPLSLWLPFERYRQTHRIHHNDERLTDPLDDPESYYWTPDEWSRVGPLTRAFLRVEQTLAGRVIIGCFWRIVRFLRSELRGIVRPHGGVMVVDIIGAADRSRTCLHDVMAAMHFASSRSNTKFGCELDYSVEDPNAQPPLQCP